MIRALIPTLARQREARALAVSLLDAGVEHVHIVVNAMHNIGAPHQCAIGWEHHPNNIGVAASWNIGMRMCSPGDLLIIANDDITLGSNTVAGLVAAAERCEDALIVAARDFPFSLFVIRAHEALTTVGAFDEQFYPAYFEDDDYRYRMQLASQQIVFVDNEELGHSHISRGTEKALGEEGRAWLAKHYAESAKRYIRKWGGAPAFEVLTAPYDYTTHSPRLYR